MAGCHFNVKFLLCEILEIMKKFKHMKTREVVYLAPFIHFLNSRIFVHLLHSSLFNFFLC